MQTALAPTIATAKPRQVPPLENGARLGATEFLRRYECSPHVRKAELIDNIVYLMLLPLRIDEHGAPDALVQTWLGNYAIATTGVQHAVNTTVKLGPDDTPQPDGLLRLLPEYGGKTRVDEDGYLAGPPELVVEVAASSASIDVHGKLNSYRRAGVREYLVWRTEDAAVDWWQLVEDEYRPLSAGDDGLLRSAVFPGLWLDASALLANDGVRLLAALSQGLASPEHLAWVAELRRRRGG